MRELRREAIGKRFPWLNLSDVDPGKFRVRAVDDEILKTPPEGVLGSLASGYEKTDVVNLRDRDGNVLAKVKSALRSHDDANPSHAGEMVGEALSRVEDLSKVALITRRVNAPTDPYYEDGPEWTVYKVRRFDLRKWLAKVRRAAEIELDAELLASCLPGLDGSDLRFVAEEAQETCRYYEFQGEESRANRWNALAHAAQKCMTPAQREAKGGSQ